MGFAVLCALALLAYSLLLLQQRHLQDQAVVATLPTGVAPIDPTVVELPKPPPLATAPPFNASDDSPAGKNTTPAPQPKSLTELKAPASILAEGTAYTQEAPGLPLYSKALALDDPSVKEAVASLKTFLKPGAWREKLPLVYNGSGVSAHMHAYYDLRADDDPVLGRLMQANLVSIGTSKVIALAIESPERPVAGLRAFFHRGTNGQLLLDWDAWVGYSEVPWKEIKIKKSQVPVLIRAVATVSDYYNHEYSDALRYFAVKLRSPDGLYSFNAYVPRETILAIAMANLVGVKMPRQLKPGTPFSVLRPPLTKALVTLRIAYGPTSESPDDVLITQLIADRWLLLPAEE